ncbi:hypothetical protein [Tenacibaculum sp. nBUS_03]
MKNNIIHKLRFKVPKYDNTIGQRVTFDSTVKKFDNTGLKFDKKCL